MHGSRIPHPHFPDVATRFYENPRQVPITPDPPPAHRSLTVGGQPTETPTTVYSSTVLQSQQTQPVAPSSQQQSTLHSSQTTKLIVDREIRDKERSSIPGIYILLILFL